MTAYRPGASLAGHVLNFIACFILLVIAPLLAILLVVVGVRILLSGGEFFDPERVPNGYKRFGGWGWG